MCRSGQNQVEILLSFFLPILPELKTCVMIPSSALPAREDRRRKAPTDRLSSSMDTIVSQKAWLPSKARQGKTDLIQQGYFYILSLKCMYNPTEVSGF